MEPHIWNSTINAQIIAGNILNALCTIDKANESTYMKTLQRTHPADRACGQPHLPDAFQPECRPCLHDLSSGTFLLCPRLQPAPDSYRAGGKEPSPAHLKNLINSCKKEKVRIIFVQPEFDRRNADLIAQQTGTRVVAINPLSYDWEEEMMNTAQALLTPRSPKGEGE